MQKTAFDHIQRVSIFREAQSGAAAGFGKGFLPVRDPEQQLPGRAGNNRLRWIHGSFG